MKPDERQRTLLARMIEERLRAQFRSNKKAFYTQANVNPATLDRALAGEGLKPESLSRIIEAGWPETAGDWQALLAGVSEKPTRSVGGDAQDQDYVAAPGERATLTITEDELAAVIRRAIEDARRISDDRTT